MILVIPANSHPRQHHRPLPPAPYLVEEPRRATAAIEAAVRACPQPDYAGKYPYPTFAQRAQLQDFIDSPYLTHREAVWLELWSTQFDSATATRLLKLLPRVIKHRRATGVDPVPHRGGKFFPERATPPRP